MSVRRAAIGAAMLLAVLGASVTARQQGRVFGVVSIRPAAPMAAADASTCNPRLLPGGVFRATHTTVYELMTFAYT